MGIGRRHRTGAVASIQGLLQGRAQIQDVSSSIEYLTCILNCVSSLQLSWTQITLFSYSMIFCLCNLFHNYVVCIFVIIYVYCEWLHVHTLTHTRTQPFRFTLI